MPHLSHLTPKPVVGLGKALIPPYEANQYPRDRMSSPEKNITSVLKETRHFPPPSGVREGGDIDAAERDRLAEWAKRDPDGFWAEQAKSLHWFKPWTQVLDWQRAAREVVRRRQAQRQRTTASTGTSRRAENKAAIIWEGEPGDTRTLTYQQLHREVCKFANALKSLGVGKGDRVTIYMPMVPEAAIAMLACARIGATHSVVFGGFSAEAVADRNNDAKSKLVITADGGWRRGKVVPLKANVDAALAKSPTVEKCIVFNRCNTAVEMKPGRDVWWHDLMADRVRRLPGRTARQRTPAVHPLHVRHHRQTEGRAAHHRRLPARRVAHAQVGLRHQGRRRLLVYRRRRLGDRAQLHRLRPARATARTVVMYEGRSEPPEGRPLLGDHREVQGHGLLHRPDRDSRVHQVGRPAPEGARPLFSLRLLGTVGEPINPEAWMWYHEVIGGGRCPIVDTWWQTETGAIMISPLPGAIPTKPGSATKPLPGIAAEVVDKAGNPVPANQGGFLVIKRPWPSMMRTIYGDDERFKAHLLEPLPRHLLHRRRRAAGRGRLHLGHGPRRRRAERERPPAQHDGSRERPGASPEGRRGRGGRPAGRSRRAKGSSASSR